MHVRKNKIHRSSKKSCTTTNQQEVGETHDEVTDRRADPVELHYRCFRVSSGVKCMCVFGTVYIKFYACLLENGRQIVTSHTLGWIDGR